MRAKGYEIKGEIFGEDALKFISFRPLGKGRFVSGSIKSLGKEYTKERIKERIELKRERKAVFPKRNYADRQLIDTSDEKFQNSPELQRWAAVENLKIAAQAYNEIGSIAEPEQKIAAASATGKEAKPTNPAILPIRNRKTLTHISATSKNSEKELKSLNRKLENLNQYLGRTEPPKSAQEQPDRDNNLSR